MDTEQITSQRIGLQTADGVELMSDHYRRRCEARGGVVLMHGFAGSRRQPEVVGQAKALAEAGFDVLVPDSRGHGESGGLYRIIAAKAALELHAAAASPRRLDIVERMSHTYQPAGFAAQVLP